MLPNLMLAVAILFLSGCNMQKTMLYYPDTSLPSQGVLEAEHITFWPTSRDEYRGFISTLPVKNVKGTIVVFHGNAGTAADRAYYVQALAPLGYRVLLAEYPGYGARRGEPGEAVFVKDAGETLRLAAAQYGKPVYVLGESLGCGIAAALAKEWPALIDGILLITPWDTLLSIAKQKFPWLPVRLLLTDTYDNIENLKAFPKNIAIAGAERDEIIPVEHAKKLCESLPGPKKMWTIKNAGHNDWPELVGRQGWQEMMDFVGGKSNGKSQS